MKMFIDCSFIILIRVSCGITPFILLSPSDYATVTKYHEPEAPKERLRGYVRRALLYRL